HVSMEGLPWISLAGSADNGSTTDLYVALPANELEWLYPDNEAWPNKDGYIGRNINWFMVQTVRFMNHVPKHYIDPFYTISDNRMLFEHLMHVCSSSEYLNLVCNACHHIRSPENQQWLMMVMRNRSDSAAKFMIEDLGQ